MQISIASAYCLFSYPLTIIFLWCRILQGWLYARFLLAYVFKFLCDFDGRIMIFITEMFLSFCNGQECFVLTVGTSGGLRIVKKVVEDCILYRMPPADNIKFITMQLATTNLEDLRLWIANFWAHLQSQLCDLSYI